MEINHCSLERAQHAVPYEDDITTEELYFVFDEAQQRLRRTCPHLSINNGCCTLCGQDMSTFKVGDKVEVQFSDGIRWGNATILAIEEDEEWFAVRETDNTVRVPKERLRKKENQNGL